MGDKENVSRGKKGIKKIYECRSEDGDGVGGGDKGGGELKRCYKCLELVYG